MLLAAEPKWSFRCRIDRSLRGEAIKPALTVIKPKNIRHEWLNIRRNPVVIHANHGKEPNPDTSRLSPSDYQTNANHDKNQITKLEEKLVKLIEDSPKYQAKNTILQSVPGIGNIAAASIIISNVPELVTSRINKQHHWLVCRSNNTWKWSLQRLQARDPRRSSASTNCFSMVMMSAMQCNPIFKATYARLLAAGKPKKVAIIACVREMVVTLNSMLRDGAMWTKQCFKN